MPTSRPDRPPHTDALPTAPKATPEPAAARILARDAAQLRVARDPGVRDDDVEPAELGHTGGETVGVAHVGDARDDPTVDPLDLGLGLGEVLGSGRVLQDGLDGRAEIDRDDVGALLPPLPAPVTHATLPPPVPAPPT